MSVYKLLRLVFVTICELMIALLTFSELLLVVGLLDHFLFVLMMNSHQALFGCLNMYAYFVTDFHYFLIVFLVLLVLTSTFYLGIFLTFEFVSLNYITLCFIVLNLALMNLKYIYIYLNLIVISLIFVINKFSLLLILTNQTGR